MSDDASYLMNNYPSTNSLNNKPFSERSSIFKLGDFLVEIGTTKIIYSFSLRGTRLLKRVGFALTLYFVGTDSSSISFTIS